MGIRTTFGKRLGRLCDAAGASFSSVDARAGKQRGHTAQLVSGAKRDPMLATALDLAAAFRLDGTSLLWLLTGRGAAPDGEAVKLGFQRGAHASKVRQPGVSHQGYDRARATESR